MIIEEKDFKLELNEFNDRFDLYLLVVINANKPDKRREEFKIVGYDMRLETCIHKIINYRLKNKVETISLYTYLQSYRSIKNELIKDLDQINVPKK